MEARFTSKSAETIRTPLAALSGGADEDVRVWMREAREYAHARVCQLTVAYECATISDAACTHSLPGL